MFQFSHQHNVHVPNILLCSVVAMSWQRPGGAYTSVDSGTRTPQLMCPLVVGVGSDPFRCALGKGDVCCLQSVNSQPRPSTAAIGKRKPPSQSGAENYTHCSHLTASDCLPCLLLISPPHLFAKWVGRENIIFPPKRHLGGKFIDRDEKTKAKAKI